MNGNLAVCGNCNLQFSGRGLLHFPGAFLWKQNRRDCSDRDIFLCGNLLIQMSKLAFILNSTLL